MVFDTMPRATGGVCTECLWPESLGLSPRLLKSSPSVSLHLHFFVHKAGILTVFENTVAFGGGQAMVFVRGLLAACHPWSSLLALVLLNCPGETNSRGHHRL